MNSKFLKNLIKGTVATTSGTIATMGFHFISIYFLSRFLSQTEFGYYALIFSISNLLNLLSNLGLEISIVKNIAEGSKLRETVLRPTLIIKTLFTIFFLILFLLLYKVYPTDGFEGLWNYNIYIVILFVLGSYRDLFYRILQGLNLFKNYSLIQISTALLRVILIISSIYLGNFNFLLLLNFEVLIIAISLIFQFLNIPFRELLRSKALFNEYLRLIKFSSPLYANNLITFTYDRIGVFIIGMLMTASSVAIYDVSSKIPSALQGILSSYVLIFFPNISTLFGLGDNENAEKLINKSISYITLLLSLLILIITLWNTELVTLFFSSKYIESAFPLIIMMFALLLRNLSNILGFAIVAAGYSKIPMKVNFVSVLVGVISTYLLVIEYNYTGAAFAVLIMNFISFFQYAYYHNKLGLIKLNFSFSYTLLVTIAFIILIFFIGIESLLIKILLFVLFIVLNHKPVIDFRKFFIYLKTAKSNS